MTITVDACYEDGVLKPAHPLPLGEHATVRVTVHTEPTHTPAGQTAPTPPTVLERQEALKRLTSLQLPVADWPQMEEEIIRGAVE